MKLLITGCAGFIGSYAVKAALARGWEVDGIDLRHPSFNRQMDTRLLSRMEADVVLHLAAFSSNAGFADRLAENYANNVMGTWNVLRLAQQCGARVLYASSSAVYSGDLLDDYGRPWRRDQENSMLVPTNSHYARSKLCNELMAASFPNTLGLRIFNAYGRGDELKGNRCAPMAHMQRAKAAGEPFVCYGDGTQAKDFIHVSDVVECIMRLIETEATGIVNIGTGVATSFDRLAELIGCEVTYAPVPDPASYQYFTRADTTQLLSLIGAYEFKSIEEGLKL